MENVAETMIALVAEQFGVDRAEVARETTFQNDLNADSLDAIELVMAVEDEFKISIPDEVVERIRSVGDLIDYITGDDPGAGVTAKLPPQKPPPSASSPPPG
jgi:acyl carrier protein